ncbi:MAG TPA: hypothetical protein VFH49_09790 [Aquabacterium sp.]|nr:hypothetical protein [Aquabacterium sp.]
MTVMTNEDPADPSVHEPITRHEVMSLADAFERSANWLQHGQLDGPARTHPLVGLADYRRAAKILRAAASMWAHCETEG